jgi:hypothetical protein
LVLELRGNAAVQRRDSRGGLYRMECPQATRLRGSRIEL